MSVRSLAARSPQERFERILRLKVKGLAQLSKIVNQKLRIKAPNILVCYRKDTASDYIVLFEQICGGVALVPPNFAMPGCGH
jgi:hypothetical protein